MKLPLTLIPSKTKINFVGQRWFAFILSIVTSLLTIVFFFVSGLNLGIDFTGGIIIETRTEQPVEIAKFREVFTEEGYKGASIQNFGDDKGILIRLQAKNSDEQAKEVEKIKSFLKTRISEPIEFRKIDYVGPKVGEELIGRGIKALFIALLGMMVYIWFRFNWHFGIGAVIALLHDAIITIGFYLMVRFEFDLTSIAAILTIIGYSINDKVVIYDRIRENLRKYKVQNLADIINVSVNETLSRTVMTVLTTFLACLALVLFGGEVIKGFSTAMLFGIVLGTYSSIYIAAPVLLYTGHKALKQ